jgi:hypothetical protein
MENTPIPLRGHHLSRIAAFETDKKVYGALMVKTGYSEHDADAFATETYDFLKSLRQDLDQRVLVTAREPDFICRACPEKMKARCIDYHPEGHPGFNTAFWERDISVNRDKEPAQKAGLEVGGTYSVREIIKATEEQTQTFKDSLRELS